MQLKIAKVTKDRVVNCICARRVKFRKEIVKGLKGKQSPASNNPQQRTRLSLKWVSDSIAVA